MFVARLSRGESHHNRDTALSTGNRNRLVFEYGFGEGLDLGGEAVGIPLHEEVVGEIGVDAFLSAYYHLVWKAVFRGDLAFAAKDFDTLIIAEGGLAAVVYRADSAATEAEQHHGSIK